jgi:hypothetical protein
MCPSQNLPPCISPPNCVDNRAPWERAKVIIEVSDAQSDNRSLGHSEIIFDHSTGLSHRPRHGRTAGATGISFTAERDAMSRLRGRVTAPAGTAHGRPKSGRKSGEREKAASGKLLGPTYPYIPIGPGFLYLVAGIDWASRAVLPATVEHDRRFVLRGRAGGGSQFTGADFTGALVEAGVRISMDGRGR